MGKSKTKTKTDKPPSKSPPVSSGGTVTPILGQASALQRTISPSPALMAVGTGSVSRQSANQVISLMRLPMKQSNGVSRAQLFVAAQRQVGNHQVARLFNGVQAKIPLSSPADPEEQEADEVASRVVSGQKVARIASTDSGLPTQGVTAKEEGLQKEPVLRQAEEEDPIQMATLQRQADSESAGIKDSSVEEARLQSPGTGRPLPDTLRAEMEEGLGADLSEVRVHDSEEDGALATKLNAKAFAYRKHIWLSPEASVGDRKLMAHELTHVVQQGGVGRKVQRYEAGEHAELGETQAELIAANVPTEYKVLKGDRLTVLARRFGITAAELKAANKSKVKKWPAANGGGYMVSGFNEGETISIPQKPNDFAKDVVKGKYAKFTVNGVVMDYGVGIAMGDFFESPEQMSKASPKELKALAVLITRERSGGTPVTTEEWQTATGGRYLKLAEKNEAHFAPPNKLVTPSTAGAASPNHKTAWQKHHKAAADLSKSGNKDNALMTNAFGDHFLTDAFSAGHLINKRDLMEKFKGQLNLDAKGEEFTTASKVFFDDVAKEAFTGGVKSEFSKFEAVETIMGWSPNINSASRFSTLLQGIHKEKPDLLANAVAKGVHDQLNKPVGLSVKNAKGDSWKLSGDGTLNKETRDIARKAVAQSQLNVTSVYKTTATLKYSNMYKKVWDYTPKPDAAGIKRVASVMKEGAEVKSNGLKTAVVNLIKKNYKLIIDELVKLKKLKKA